MKYPFNKIKILWWATIALERSFWLIYSNTHLKGTVSRELRHRLLYIIQNLFSGAMVAHQKILILVKGYFALYKKKIQHKNSPTILDGLHNSRWGKHVRWAYFSSGDILIKHYGIVGTAESRIMLLIPNFLRQPCINELHYRGCLVI